MRDLNLSKRALRASEPASFLSLLFVSLVFLLGRGCLASHSRGPTPSAELPASADPPPNPHSGREPGPGSLQAAEDGLQPLEGEAYSRQLQSPSLPLALAAKPSGEGIAPYGASHQKPSHKFHFA